ncbi:MAG: hypothetical protein HY703_07885 [Gemmatimonadetes bacterium]|nr:hypothetical protein [Gemmatimonadota bacterium]
MNGPAALVEHLARYNYHPRSDAHSNATCRGILEDLLADQPISALPDLRPPAGG